MEPKRYELLDLDVSNRYATVFLQKVDWSLAIRALCDVDFRPDRSISAVSLAIFTMDCTDFVSDFNDFVDDFNGFVDDFNGLDDDFNGFDDDFNGFDDDCNGFWR
jgi:hypothetical protein